MSSSDSLSLYFNEVEGRRLLTREEESELAQRMEKGDASARDKLIRYNLRLVASIAKNFQGQGCDLEDLIQEGNIGLMDGIDRFDWERGLKLSTYATWWIRQRLDRLISNHGRTVRVPVHVQTLAAKLRKLLDAYHKEFDCDPSIEEVMQMLDCTQEMAKAAMNTIMPNPTITLDHSPSNQNDNDETLHSYIEDKQSINPVDLVSHYDLVALIRDVIKTLPPRDEKILRLRFGISEDANLVDDSYRLTDKEAKGIKRRIRNA
jgi:RNA polymerase primary sigma factor